MRADMAKVLTERQRVGHSRCYHDIRSRHHRGEIEYLPTMEGMRRPHILLDTAKQFSDLLGPLKRFLWSSRGRRWDDVWSEINAELPHNTTGAHLRLHVSQEVTLQTELHRHAGRYFLCPRRRRRSARRAA